MCGGCRVLVNGKSEFACVDGPEFDAHRVDFAVLVQRNSMYRDAEQRSLADFQSAKHVPALPEDHVCVVPGSAVPSNPQGEQR
jgi:hypothetical protein